MTRKHFEALAAALQNTLQAAQDGLMSATTAEGTARYAAYEVAAACARFNPHFDRTRFLKACGVEETK